MDCYQDKLLTLAKEKGVQTLQGEKLEDIYNEVFQKIMVENQELEMKYLKFYEMAKRLDLEKAENINRINEMSEIINNYKKEIESSNVNQLINKNISRILKELLTRTKDNEIKELIDMIDILRMTRI